MAHLSFTLPHGLLAEDPEIVVDALATIAEAEGEDRAVWLDNLAKAAGAKRVSVPVRQKPKYRVIQEAIDEANEVYDTAMSLALSEIRTVLQAAYESVDRDELRGRTNGK